MTDSKQGSAPRCEPLTCAALWFALGAGCQKAPPADIQARPQQPLQTAPQSASSAPDEVPVPSDQAQPERTVFDLDGQIITADARDGEQIGAALERRIGELQNEGRERLLGTVPPGDVVVHADTMEIGFWGLQVHGAQLRLLHRTGPGAAPAYGADVNKTPKGWEVGPIEHVFIHARRP